MGRRAGGRAAQGHLVRPAAALSRKFRTLPAHPSSARRQARGAGRGGRNRPGFCRCRAGCRGGIRVAIPVACQLGPAAGQGARDLGPGPGLLRAQRRRRCRDRRGIIVEGGGPAGARPGHALGGAWLGPQGAGLGPPCPRGPRPRWCGDRLSLREQGLLTDRHRHQRKRPELQPRRPADGAAAEVAAGLWRARRILWFRQQASGLGDGGTLARPRLAVAHSASARPGRPADPCERSEAISRSIVALPVGIASSPSAPRNDTLETDVLAAAIGADPVAFRLRYLKAPRDIAVVKAAAERAKWETRPSPNPDRNGDTLTGRGIAYAQRSGAVVAIVAEVEIDRHTGKVWARKFTVAHDCGLIINPDGLKR